VEPVFDVPGCDACAAPAVVHQRYSGRRYCGRHLDRSVRKKVGKELRQQLHLDGRHTTILVAISGGKDSAVLLSMLHDLLGKRPDVTLIGGCVDEGIEGYRPPSMEAAKQLCADLGLRFEHVAFRDLEFLDMDDVVDAMGRTTSDGAPTTACAYCGVFRRQGINALAQRVGADVVALGHNLDDVAQTVMMNLVAGKVERSLRMAPHTHRVEEGLAPRIIPLRPIPEQEVHLVALHRGLPMHHETCPNAEGAQRWRMRETVAQLEEERPGTRHGLVRTLDAIRSLAESGEPERHVNACQRCDGPSSGPVCKACEMRSHLGLR